MIFRTDKLFSPLLSLQTLSCLFSHLEFGQRKQRPGLGCFWSLQLLASTQQAGSIKASLKSIFSKEYLDDLFPEVIPSSRRI